MKEGIDESADMEVDIQARDIDRLDRGICDAEMDEES
jgi:hypothetical protein